MQGSPGSSLTAVSRQTEKLRREVQRLQAENFKLRQVLEYHTGFTFNDGLAVMEGRWPTDNP